MTTLITLLISLLGYGSPADYADLTEDQLNMEIIEAQEEANSSDGGNTGQWDTGSLHDDTSDL